jgi:hypothetical protein
VNSQNPDLKTAQRLATEMILSALQAHVATQDEETAYTFLKFDDELLSITYRVLDPPKASGVTVP